MLATLRIEGDERTEAESKSKRKSSSEKGQDIRRRTND
jgi:hypothetical protein